MDLERFGRRMIELLPQLVRGFARQEHNDLSRGKLTLPQLWALDVLARQARGCPMKALAHALGISRPTATGLMDRLIAQGFTRRVADPSDRRVVRVMLTAKGQRVLANIWEQKRRTLVTVFGRISPADRAQYLSTLERVVSILDQQPSRRL